MDYFTLYKDIWNFHKQYMNIAGTDAEYEKMLDDADQLSKKYGNHQFIIDMIVAITKEVERTCRQSKQTNTNDI